MARTSSSVRKVWEVHTGQEIREITTPQLLILALAFTPDGKTLASGGLDSTILLWNVHGNPTAKLPLVAKDSMPCGPICVPTPAKRIAPSGRLRWRRKRAWRF